MITFYKLIEQGIAPQRADASGLGTLPTNGFRYCEALRAASAYGWYIFMPFDLQVLWDGYEYKFSIDEGENWYDLDAAIQYPHFSDAFDEVAPEELKGYAPPFVSRTNDHNILQIWSGVFAKTEPNTSLLVRSPANLARPIQYDVIEGVMETDWWFGPLFTNIKLHRPGDKLVIRGDRPFIQVQPVSNALRAKMDKVKDAAHIGLGGLTDDCWEAYRDTVIDPMNRKTRFGTYAAHVRKRHKQAEQEETSTPGVNKVSDS